MDYGATKGGYLFANVSGLVFFKHVSLELSQEKTSLVMFRLYVYVSPEMAIQEHTITQNLVK